MSERQEVPELGPLEYQLLRLLWKLAPASAREVLEAYNRKARRPLKYTTVMTLLTRMSEKGVLEADRSRQPFEFRPLVSREQMLAVRVHDFVDRFFEGSAVDLAVRLVQESELSEDSIRRLEQLLREKSAERAGEEEQ